MAIHNESSDKVVCSSLIVVSKLVASQGVHRYLIGLDDQSERFVDLFRPSLKSLLEPTRLFASSRRIIVWLLPILLETFRLSLSSERLNSEDIFFNPRTAEEM